MSSGETGSSPNDLLSDANAEETRVADEVVSDTNAPTKAEPGQASEVADIKATGDGKEAEDTKASEKPPDAEKVADKDEVVIKEKLPEEVKDSDHVAQSDELPKEIKEAAVGSRAEDGDVADVPKADSEAKQAKEAEAEKESKESSEDTAGKGDATGHEDEKGPEDEETASAKSFGDSESGESQCELTENEVIMEQWLIKIEKNRASRRRRSEEYDDDDDDDEPVHREPVPLLPAPSMSSFEEDDDDEDDMSDGKSEGDDKQESRATCDVKWENTIAALETELANEARRGFLSESLSKIGAGDAANEDQEDEWLVTFDSDRLRDARGAVPASTVGAAKLAAKESCVCLRRIFPQPKGFEFGGAGSPRFDSGLPVPDPEERVRQTPLEKIVLRKDDVTLAVQFQLKDGETYTRSFQRSVTLLDVRRNLARVFKMPVEMIVLQKDGITLLDKDGLGTLGRLPSGGVEMCLTSHDPVNFPVLVDGVLEEEPDDAVVPSDVITVTTQLANGVVKELVVEIWYAAIDKPWVGGYRDVTTLLDYHHAFSQTPPLPKKPKVHRDTQTRKPPVTQFQNTPYDKGTQMSRDDYFVPNVEDRIVTAQAYIAFDDNLSYLKKIITIQRYFRALLIRRMLKNMSMGNREHLSKKADLQRKKDGELELLLTGQAIRSIYPRSRHDFSVLYQLVERWRRAEIARAFRLKTIAPRKAELCQVLDKEVLLLNAIETHRIAVKKEKLEKKEIDFMDKSAHPITWVGAKGKVVSMATINTQRAAELRDLYHQLTASSEDIEQRLTVLVSVKHAISAFSCANSKAFDIVALIDRECDVLAHGLKDNQLDFLRKRLAQAFRAFMKVPAFNPEGAKHFTEETAYLLSRANMHRCTRCNKYMPRDKFMRTNRMRTMQHCVSCAWLQSVAGDRVDLAQVRTIMRALRREEKKRCCSASIAFIMQEEDFYFLINNIWHGRSPIGECDYLPELRLSRWDTAADWSPWNCILLTDLEMHSHMRTGRPELTYNSCLVADVTKKHQIAFIHFKRILEVDNL